MTENQSTKIYIFTDGACSGNPGPGGWGAVIQKPSGTEEISGGDMMTTNNRMEMQAVIKALEWIQSDISSTLEIVLCTDSLYVKDGITQWVPKWKANGWMTANRTPVKNMDLWKELDALVGRCSVTWQWVRGHSGHEQNERADFLARNAIVSQMMQSSII